MDIEDVFSVALAIVILIATWVAILAIPVLLLRWAWNELAPLFHAPLLTFWQAGALCVVLAVIGSFIPERKT